MAIQRLEAQCRVATDGAVMASVILALVVPAAADAWKLGVTFTHPGVEGLLRVLQVIRPALQLLLADLDLPALNLVQRLACLLLVHVLDGKAAGVVAHRLPEALRDE